MAEIYHHGARVVEINTGRRAIRTIATAIIGMVCTAPLADPATFPLDTPVLLTDLQKAIDLAGPSGTLRKSLQAIDAQCRPFVVVVRVAPGIDDAGTDANVIGTTSEGSHTGLQALLTAHSMLGVKPRILGAPGLDASQSVAQAIGVLAGKLRAFAYVSAGGAVSKEEAALYRENFAPRELMVIYPEWRAFNTTTSATEDVPAVAYALGLRAKIDIDQGWHKTLSNVAVSGVTGISIPVSWDLMEPNTDAGFLNAADVTTLVRNNGFRFWGSRTCSDDPLFAFESATRSAQVIADSIGEAMMVFVDKPLHPSIVRDIIETINAKGRSWVSGGYLLGFNAWYDPEANSETELSSGILKIDYDYTPVPPIENLLLRQRITDQYMANFAAGLVDSRSQTLATTPSEGGSSS